jgi:hypothetical protein
MRKVRNTLIVLAGFVLLGLVVGLIDRSAEKGSTQPAAAEAAPARPPKIFRMEATLEELRKFPEIDGMLRADDVAYRALPKGLEVAGQWVAPDAVLEGYAHPNGRRFFIIMKPGDRAYSVFLD